MPRLALYYVDNHKIEVVKTLLGKQKVLLNGKTVSEKSKDDKTQHFFVINQSNYRIVPRERKQADKMNTYEVFKDSSPIVLVNAVQKNPSKIFLLIIAIGLGSGFIFGVFIYKLLFPVEV